MKTKLKKILKLVKNIKFSKISLDKINFLRTQIYNKKM